MCGIAGFVGDGDVKVLTRMIEKLRYRGPDDLGVWHEGNIGLAHSRLSIIDLSKRGHQPMHSIDGKIIITFNGEIYNFRELKTKLEQKGKIFKSQSDTEVIIQLYEVYGEESFEKLEGMFAFGLYDKKEEKFMLVRDRMGEKPLYWTIENDTLIFASEVKAILEYSNSSKKINPQSIISYLSHDSVLTPKSIYSNINKLEPATYAVYKNKKIRKNKYWNPPQKISNNKSFSEISESLDNALEKSVRDRLVADVPVGVFLSGGLDSSIIAYYATKNSNKPVHTFSLGFHEKSYDESKYARECANFLGTEHHEKIVSADEVRDALHTVVKKFDEPIADPAILPNYLLSSFAKERVKVALGGDGGDELFAGYQTFTADKLLNSYQMLPEVVRKNLIEPLVNSLPVYTWGKYDSSICSSSMACKF
jgi:asparagine synthase (glutamine-hydrolysing)